VLPALARVTAPVLAIVAGDDPAAATVSGEDPAAAAQVFAGGARFRSRRGEIYKPDAAAGGVAAAMASMAHRRRWQGARHDTPDNRRGGRRNGPW
jgi:hypothetical protein